MNLIRHIPNGLTICNLLCGCAGIISTFTDSPRSAAVFVWVACVFDFFDGLAARALNVNSPIGKELDSLADMVSFGALPAFVMYRLIESSTNLPWLSALGFSIAAFSALRLAKFNIDERQHDKFIGLPTPANAIFITGLVFLPRPLDSILHSDIALVAVAIVSSLLLVSPLELIALKFKTYSWADNRLRFTFLLLAVLSLVIWRLGALSLIIPGYIVLSLFSRGDE